MGGRAIAIASVLFVVVSGCRVGGGSPYDPSWDPTGPIADGKADGLLDIVPRLEFGQPVTGDVGGDRVELYSIELLRTDRIQVELTVTDGDLDPHVTLYLGTHTYVDSESWSREGDTLRKTYVIAETGRYLVAVRAYHGQGSGDYRLTLGCLGGPCSGELPPPASAIGVDDAVSCIAQARRCAFARLPRYDGAVGPARAHALMTECLGEASLEDGGSCAAACQWQGDEPDETSDDAVELCDGIERGLAFYADQPAGCLELLDRCMGECYDAAGYGHGSSDRDIWETTESLCWKDGLNGNCDSLARGHEACGGEMRADSAAECVELCESTTGAHIDDLDTLCGSDADCEDHCEVDLAQGAEVCGGLVDAHMDCLRQHLDRVGAWICEDALAEALGNG